MPRDPDLSHSFFLTINFAYADVRVDPTPANQIPAAITGNAGDLQGKDLPDICLCQRVADQKVQSS